MKEPNDRQLAATARQRGAVYGLLSRCYVGEIDKVLLARLKDERFAEAMTAVGLPFDRAELCRPAEGLLEELAVDYAWLFLGPGEHLSPHESVQRPDVGKDSQQFWGPATAQVKQFIEACGFAYDDDFNGIPDHIGVELEFMAQLCMAEAEAWQRHKPTLARQYQGHQKRFLEHHLLIWVPSFCEKVAQRAQMSLYRFIAQLTGDFVAADHEMIGSHAECQSHAA